MPQFPKTLAAAARVEEDTWALADAVLKECGPPGQAGAHDDKITACANELAANGFEYEVATLQHYRLTAYGFTPSARRHGDSLAVCQDAGTPAMLAAVKKLFRADGSKKVLAKRDVRKWRAVIERDAATRESADARRERERLKAEADAKVASAKKAAKAATDLRERKKADADVQAAKREASAHSEAPLPDYSKVTKETLPASIRALEVEQKCSAARRLATEAAAMLDELNSAELTAAQADALTEALQGVINEWQAAKGHLTSRRAGRSTHLALG